MSEQNDINCYQFEEPEDEGYYTRGIHQKLKHKFIEKYLEIWVNSVKGGPSVDMFDLFAASGKAKCSDTGELYDGSALILTKAFFNYRKKVTHRKKGTLILNSFDPDPKICENQLERLKTVIKEYLISEKDNIGEFTKGDVLIMSNDISKAAESSLNLLNRDFPSVWILDPENPRHLPWKIVEEIGSSVGEQFTDKKTKKLVRKKPELIINLMTSTLQRTFNSNPHIFSEAIGWEEKIWRPKAVQYEKEWLTKGIEEPTRHVILDLYAERLSELYEKKPIITLVKSSYGNVVYSMLLCTDSDAGYYMMRKKKLPEYRDYEVFEWRSEVTKIKDHGQTTLI